MATGVRGRRRLSSRQHRSALRPIASRSPKFSVKKVHQEKEIHQRKKSKIASEKKDWEDATCSVCMEYPHDAVLLLCSSHDKGCRPYMCGTSYHFSNCLEQFKKAYTKVVSPPPGHHYGSRNSVATSILSHDKHEVLEVACPLCRGEVKGMTVVEPARDYLNTKRRSCAHENCSFIGTYNELRKHVNQEHPYTRPKAKDPILEQKWRRLEREREHDDVLSAIRSSMPGALVVGDYVMERNNYSSFSEDSNDSLDISDGEDSRLFSNLFLDRLTYRPATYRPASFPSLNARLSRLRTARQLSASMVPGNRTSTFAADSNTRSHLLSRSERRQARRNLGRD